MKKLLKKFIKDLDNPKVVEIENELIFVYIPVLYFPDISYLYENLIG
jgi:hypothetical protein